MDAPTPLVCSSQNGARVIIILPRDFQALILTVPHLEEKNSDKLRRIKITTNAEVLSCRVQAPITVSYSSTLPTFLDIWRYRPMEIRCEFPLRQRRAPATEKEFPPPPGQWLHIALQIIAGILHVFDAHAIIAFQIVTLLRS
jgi:hypothetical protein